MCLIVLILGFILPGTLCGFHGNSAGKESACHAGDPSLIPGSGRFPGEGIGSPLQYPWASLVAQLVKNLPTVWETWVQSLGSEGPQLPGFDWLFPFPYQEVFTCYLFKYFFGVLSVFSFWDPIMRMLMHLMLSQWSLRLYSFFLPPPLFFLCSVLWWWFPPFHPPGHLSILLPQSFCY